MLCPLVCFAGPHPGTRLASLRQHLASDSRAGRVALRRNSGQLLGQPRPPPWAVPQVPAGPRKLLQTEARPGCSPGFPGSRDHLPQKLSARDYDWPRVHLFRLEVLPPATLDTRPCGNPRPAVPSVLPTVVALSPARGSEPLPSGHPQGRPEPLVLNAGSLVERRSRLHTCLVDGPCHREGSHGPRR